MAGKRSYSVAFANISVTALQDLIAVYCGASQVIELHGINIGQVSGITVQNLRISVKRLPVPVTPGSGGNSASIQKMGRSDAASVVTARTNDTTQASTSGTAALLHADVFNTINGYQFFWPPTDAPTFGINEACILSLDMAPSASMSMRGTLYFAEII